MGGISVYSATKHAVKGLTEALSVEFKRLGLRAADTLPGLINTPLITEETIARAAREGMWRICQPIEVAQVVWHAYHTDKIHWYVPPELLEFDQMATAQPEAVRDQITGDRVLETLESL
jgi:short-subunit dehydrogenase